MDDECTDSKQPIRLLFNDIASIVLPKIAEALILIELSLSHSNSLTYSKSLGSCNS